MVSDIVVADNGVALDELVLVDSLRLLVCKLCGVIRIITFFKLYLVTVLVFEDKEVGSLLDDGVFDVLSAMQNERVAKYLEPHGLAGRVGIEDRVALGFEGDALLIFVHPYTL